MDNNDTPRAKSEMHNAPETSKAIQASIDKEHVSFLESLGKLSSRTRSALAVMMMVTAATISTGCNQKTHSAESAKDRQKLEEALRLETPEAVIFVLAHLKKVDPDASRMMKNGHRKAMDIQAEECVHQLTINLTGTENYSNEDLATTRRLLTERLNQILKSGDLDTLNSPGVQALLRELAMYGYIDFEGDNSSQQSIDSSKKTDSKSQNNSGTRKNTTTHQSPQFDDEF